MNRLYPLGPGFGFKFSLQMDGRGEHVNALAVGNPHIVNANRISSDVQLLKKVAQDIDVDDKEVDGYVLGPTVTAMKPEVAPVQFYILQD